MCNADTVIDRIVDLYARVYDSLAKFIDVPWPKYRIWAMIIRQSQGFLADSEYITLWLCQNSF